MTGNPGRPETESIVLFQRGRDNVWRKRMAKLRDDNTVDYKGRTWIVGPNCIDYWPTVWNQLGLSRGVRPMVIVDQTKAIPFIVGNDEAKHDSSVEIARFKKMKVEHTLVQASQKEGNSEVIKMLVIAALAGVGVVAIMLIYLISKVIPILKGMGGPATGGP